MAIEILYFAWVREGLGLDGERIDPPPGVGTIAALIDWLAERGSPYAETLADRSRLRAAVDGRFVAPDASIADAREIALFPPVTGG